MRHQMFYKSLKINFCLLYGLYGLILFLYTFATKHKPVDSDWWSGVGHSEKHF